MKNNITYIVSNINKSLAFEWISTYLNKDDFNLCFILLNVKETELEIHLKNNNILVYRVNYTGKKDLPKAIFKTYKILKKTKTKIIHAHLFDASIVGLIASRICNIKKRIYTRHHSTYHQTYFPKTVKWDKFCNFLATDIVAISENVKDVLINLENVPEKKITKIYHGFDIKSFSNPNEAKINILKEKYGVTKNGPIIGVISRFTKWKGIQFIIPAFKKLLNEYPTALLLLFNASGDYEKEIDLKLNELPKNSYKKIVFENEIASVYHLFDVFIHTPIDNHCEAFGQTYIESMASGIPLIATKSGIGTEILVDGKNSIIVSYKNSEEIYAAMIKVLSDKAYTKEIIKNASLTVKNNFSIEIMINNLEKLYSK